MEKLTKDELVKRLLARQEARKRKAIAEAAGYAKANLTRQERRNRRHG